ncbi:MULTISPECIES: NAD(P)-dependent oxidoreductase [unclassified Bradyrhizobium]|uniref:NAD-dependent epimerase/dehydratase family protein n=1 Tax=unclassified Bradyrhizobium TaxID=2631580 RepID=UPI001BA60B50|nr:MULTISPECIES: NAD(P)-dependent oxidoreductase [unclassified Bradyrhizobium]MBR1229347.1 NAD(P)-dependent oxidoreductase [Bradyrhizobium sp. AUGA SZCCT0176]MBR1301002.1 NAD(P)-dependent oxidoreductase [Bradyrhizobium sp. AUGA SZCCT0042]
MTKGLVLVTGGNGYVGRELVRQLIAQRDCEVHVLDNMASGEHRLAQMDEQAFVLHRQDIRDADAVSELLKKIQPSIIYHLAAVHFIPACEAEPGNAVAINVAGTVNLLNATPAGTKFVFASSAAVYRPLPDAHLERDEDLGPVDVYGYTKLHGEHFVRHYHNQNKVRGIIVRLFNVVGPGETNPHLVPAIISQLASGNHQLALGNLFPHRDYIDVSDVGSGFRALARHDDFEGGPLISNLGTGNTHSVGDVVATIGTAAGVTLDIQQDPLRMRAVDRPMLKASTQKLKQITGWTPSISLAESMHRAWTNRMEDGLT